MRQDDVPCCEPMFWVYLTTCLGLVSFAGLTSGLALGLLSFTQVDLEVLIKAGQPQDRDNAAKILPIVKKEHLLLCTLLISKTLAMEALPIFLDRILPSWGAILMSVILVLAFGEILPQAACARYGLSFGAKLSILVRFLLLVLFPIAHPISKLLDWLLGKGHSVLLRRAELKTLVDLHGKESGRGGELTHEEIAIICGALDLTQKTAKDAMTPISKTFSLDVNSKLNRQTMGLIMSKGHSRIPIYFGSQTNIVGLILVKNLIFCHPEDETPIRNLTIRRIPRVHDNWPLYDILNQFQKGHSHMAVVVKCKKDVEEDAENAEGNLSMLEIKVDPDSNSAKTKKEGQGSPQLNCKQGNENFSFKDSELFASGLDSTEVTGIITMEDVLEELLQGQILDETDACTDIHNKIRMTLLSSRRSSPISSAGAPVSPHIWRTPEQSPVLHSYSPVVLRSPISPYILPPLIRPTLLASPGMSAPNSPAVGSIGPVRNSPSSNRVSRKSYEKLRQPNGS
ncbi:DUF21 domain-containing protein At5g52790 [Malania oleifera]|uniref:DUF21 domain-containing protein At5g52790 n=1 Tax=Malania oleifera TaxID=397392 RepID=UPI0025ADA56E|nr:DUF21 domain-containing protein At5g52790 [Malania oleifera]